MSFKKICDRCGEDIDKDGDDNELHFTKLRNTRYSYDKLLHLCDDCLKDFDDFMKDIIREKKK